MLKITSHDKLILFWSMFVTDKGERRCSYWRCFIQTMVATSSWPKTSIYW